MSAPEDQTTIHVRAAQDGQTDSIEWIVQRFSPALELAARYRMSEHLQRAHPPTDAVSELWMLVLPRLASLRTREGRLTPVLMSYLATTLRGHVNNLARRFARARFLQDGSADDEMIAPEIAADQTDVIRRATRHEAARHVHEALEQLSSDDRELIVRRAIEGERNVDVAASLGIPPNTCATRYSRAIERLRSLVPGSVFDEIDADS